MPTVKLTKNELKRQRESLILFNKYLPMLLLKKQQLQMELRVLHDKSLDLSTKINNFKKDLNSWIAVFAEDIKIQELFKIKNIVTESGNVAGIEIPLFKDVEIETKIYDFYTTPFWVDSGIDVLKKMVCFNAELLILDKQKEILENELQIATQRVNLFEKVKIPEAEENIRLIRIYLGDLFTVEVVRGKIAKSKLEQSNSLKS